jgi:NAD(P) transhydrogenase subunit alpha
MRIFSPTETESSERRVAIVPASVTKLTALGAQVAVEAGIGASVNFSDPEYRDAGAEIVADRRAALASADIVLRLRKPPSADIAALKRACIHVSFLDPFTDVEPVRSLAARGVSVAGYVAVLLGANRLDRIFPMMMTPAGTIPPAKVFIIGVGVAGLQAIATAKRLGAVVEAFDTRPGVEEQVKSLGGKFVKVDLGEIGQTAQGYAKELTPEQLAKQREVMEQRCAQADLVITTAQVFGRKAPVIITKAMLEKMKPGTIVVDMAVESGGNVECSIPDEDIVVNGVKIIGWRNLAGRVPRAASAMYSSNLTNLVDHFWDRTAKTFRLDPANEILRDCLVTHDGAIVNERIRTLAL